MKKIISLLLCIVLTVAALAVFSVAASAGETDTPAATNDVTPKGYQNRNSGYGVRIVAQIANAENYREVGFVLSDGTKETTRAATYMFKTLLASDTEGGDTYVTLTAEEGCYLFALAIEEVAAERELTLVFKPYAVDKNGNTLYGAEKTLVKAKNAGFTEGEAHTTHTPVHHEATAATAASYATAWNTEYWTCTGCTKLFGDAACTTVVEADAVMAPAQKDNADCVNSETNPYLLANVADWQAYAEAVNGGDNMSGKYVKLTADIGTEDAPVTTAIGTSSNPYCGNFDGNGKEVYVNLSSTSAIGVFAYYRGGSISNLTVRGTVAYTNTTTTEHSTVGGVVGMILKNATATITNCKNYATIQAPDNCSAGGIVGKNNGGVTISGCTNYGNVNGGKLGNNNRSIGGIIGWINQVDTRIENCINNGAVSSTGSAATTAGTGGIVGISGMSRAVIDGCINNGTVSGYRFIGGVIGRVIENATITNVSNTAAISGTRDIGGIIGGTDNAKTSSTFNELYVTGATNSGAVTGTGDFIGGIVGYINSTGNVLTDCTNTGNITGVKCVGGIIGLVNGSKTATVDNATVRDCTISGSQSVGGWIGRIVAKATATYKHYTAPTGVTYKLNGVEMTATAGFDTTNRTTGAETTTPGEAFGTCAGTATNVTE